MAKRLGVDVRVTRALLEIGTMCAEQKRFDDAEAIIRATKAHRDDLPHPGTTLAMAYLYQDRLDEAEAELETVLAAFPNHQLGKALLGWTRRQAGQQGWQQPLEEVIDDGRDEWAIRLARTVLDVGGRAPVASRPAMAPRRERPMTLVHPGRYAGEAALDTTQRSRPMTTLSPVHALPAIVEPAGASPQQAPTAAQAARFAEQLGDGRTPAAGAAFSVYQAPAATPLDRADFRPLVDYAARASDSMRDAMAPLDLRAASAAVPELTPLIESIARANATTLATMQFNLIAETVQSASRNVHTLYQQQG